MNHNIFRSLSVEESWPVSSPRWRWTRPLSWGATISTTWRSTTGSRRDTGTCLSISLPASETSMLETWSPSESAGETPPSTKKSSSSSHDFVSLQTSLQDRQVQHFEGDQGSRIQEIFRQVLNRCDALSLPILFNVINLVSCCNCFPSKQTFLADKTQS